MNFYFLVRQSKGWERRELSAASERALSMGGSRLFESDEEDEENCDSNKNRGDDEEERGSNDHGAGDGHSDCCIDTANAAGIVSSA